MAAPSRRVTMRVEPVSEKVLQETFRKPSSPAGGRWVSSPDVRFRTEGIDGRSARPCGFCYPLTPGPSPSKLTEPIREDSVPHALRVSVLGPVRAWIGDRQVDLGPGRQRAVFAVLAAHAGRLVSRDELISAIWGDSPPATAAGSIYTYVSGLRRALTPGLLTSASGGYLLRVDPAGLDADQFQQLRSQSAELIAAGHDRAAADRLDEALGLWRGDAYATLAGPFLELDRQRLAELR